MNIALFALAIVLSICVSSAANVLLIPLTPEGFDFRFLLLCSSLRLVGPIYVSLSMVSHRGTGALMKFWLFESLHLIVNTGIAVYGYHVAFDAQPPGTHWPFGWLALVMTRQMIDGNWPLWWSVALVTWMMSDWLLKPYIHAHQERSIVLDFSVFNLENFAKKPTEDWGACTIRQFFRVGLVLIASFIVTLVFGASFGQFFGVYGDFTLSFVLFSSLVMGLGVWLPLKLKGIKLLPEPSVSASVSQVIRGPSLRDHDSGTTGLPSTHTSTNTSVRGPTLNHHGSDDTAFPPPGSIFFGAEQIPVSEVVTHFLVTGKTGSGKSLTLRLMMQSALPLIQPEADTRAIIYDAKQDILPTLRGMGLTCPFYLIQPFDCRSVAWDMARDIRTVADAEQVAHIFVPKNDNDHNPFFADAARAVLRGLVIALIDIKPLAWTLRDLILATENLDFLKAILNQSGYTKGVVKSYLQGEKTTHDILSTLATKLSGFGIIAALWSRAESTLSLEEWVKSDSILVMGNYEKLNASVQAVNRLLFKRLSELLLSQSDSKTRRTWIFLDELKAAGQLEGLQDVLIKGRSKGIATVLGFQEISGLRALYEDEVEEICGQCSHQAHLKAGSADHAEWASKQFGTHEVIEQHESHSQSTSGLLNSGGSVSQSETQTVKPLVLPSELLSIPPTNPANGLTGYYKTGEIPAFRKTLSGRFLSRALIPEDESLASFEPRSANDERLEPWSDAELEALGLSSPTPVPPAPGPAPSQKRRKRSAKDLLKRLDQLTQ